MALQNTAAVDMQTNRRPRKRKRRNSGTDKIKPSELPSTSDPVRPVDTQKPAPLPKLTTDYPIPSDRIGELEAQLKHGGIRSANLLLDLISEIKPSSPDATRAIHASRRALSQLSKLASVDTQLQKWLSDRRIEFSSALATLLSSSSSTTEASESAVAVAAVFGGDIWCDAVRASLCSSNARIVDVVGECFVFRFGDLRLLSLQNIADGAGVPARRLTLLGYCVAPAVEASVKPDVPFPCKRHLRRTFSAAWMSLLQDERISRSDLCNALAALPDAIPCLANPLDVADFLKSCYSDGGNSKVAIAALDPLFILISKYGLDYPLFYHKLYALLTPEILFHNDENERFLEMTAMFLRFGEFVPGGIIAAFVKRLARRALVAPPAGAMWCLRLALDLLYKHPNVSFLVHRAISLFDDAPAKKSVNGLRKTLTFKGEDPFDDSEVDPQESRAEESSLWELEALRNHISPAVSRLVLAFSKDVRKKPMPPPGDVADYAALSFADVFEAEFKRKAKNTTIAYDAPGEAPGVKEVFEDIGGSILWR